MIDQFAKYTEKLLHDRIALPGSIRFYRLDDEVIASRTDEWLPLFTEVFRGLNVTALLFARPPLRLADMLVEAEPEGRDRIVPNDSETKTFHHDFPFIRTKAWRDRPAKELAAMIVAGLKERKAVIIQDLGFVSSGGITVEQAYIAYSTLFHTTFLKFCLDVLERGFRSENERQAFAEMRQGWGGAVDSRGLRFRTGPLEASAECGVESLACKSPKETIFNEISRVGRATVEKGLVDSFFGNISYFDGRTIYISQTASSLDELEGHIDPVPLDGSSTAGLSASSELPAHRAIYQATPFHAVLHGHPKFSVILSMYCREDCEVEDCGKNCSRRRSVRGIPIVSGELGAGGLAKTVPPAVRESGVCIVYGHGVFSAGEKDFHDAFRKMVDVENTCREEYFRLTERGEGKRVRS